MALDLSYGDRMSSKEQISLARQLSRCWGCNRSATCPVALHLTGLDTCPPGCLPPGEQVERWKVHRHAEDVADAFPRAELVFLSPDADEPLGALEPRLIVVTSVSKFGEPQPLLRLPIVVALQPLLHLFVQHRK